MTKLQGLLEQGLQVSAAFGTARQAFAEWQEAIATARGAGELADEEMPKLQARLDAVHAESMQMSQELDAEIERQRKR